MHWGPSLWAFIHTVAISPLVDHKSIFKNIENVIPCSICKKTYMDYVTKLDGTTDFFAWSVDLHNEVNSKLNKPLMTYNEAREKWSNQ
jgi:hypothetical protein